MRFIGVLNKGGGTLRTMDLPAFVTKAEEVFSAAGHSLDCRIVDGSELIPALKAAVAEPGIDALLAGGGDGTISAAADLCFRAGLPLAVLPAGTMNLFARSLKIPLNLDLALNALAAGEVKPADIATANGRPFVHQFSVGLHPRLVRIRDGLTYHSRWGKMLASLRAISLTVRRPPVFQVEIRTPAGLDVRTASSVSVSNNPMGEGHFPHADALDQGVLGVYVVKPLPTAELLRLSVDLLLGSWQASAEVTGREVTEVSLWFPKNRASTRAVIDGELVNLRDRVDLKIHPGALKVVVPKAEPLAQAAQ